MKRWIFPIVLLAVITVYPCRPVSATENMVTDATKDSIQIGVRYSGERIYFFGTLPDPQADLVVKLTSKEASPLKVSRKGKVLLFWMSVKQYEITGMPQIYKIHTSGPLEEILTPALAKELKIGYGTLQDGMGMTLLRGESSPDDREMLFEGFLNLKKRQDLYRIRENTIRIAKGKLFEHSFNFPDKAREGEYVIESYAVKDGKVIGSSKNVIDIGKIGLTAWLYRKSQNNGVFYGIMAVVIALGAGLLVGVIFKGGGH
jgi:uncharacterized protein (TIGR02186 family)